MHKNFLIGFFILATFLLEGCSSVIAEETKQWRPYGAEGEHSDAYWERYDEVNTKGVKLATQYVEDKYRDTLKVTKAEPRVATGFNPGPEFVMDEVTVVSWGFYCTKNQKQAEKFNTSLVNMYELKNMEDLNVKKFKDYSDEWLEFVVSCRSGKTHEYDVVIGPMADDTIYDYIEAYSIGQMNKEKFFKLMKFKYPTHQISFHTIKALNCIEFVDCYEVADA